MKDEPNIPLETVGDGPLEARIVAVVLGEASAFEIAEVERLCRERPELLIFQQRIRALHGLLKENASITSGADEAWKLPAEKRKLLEAVSASVAEPPIVHSRWLRKSVIALFAVAACATLVASVLHFRPKKFDAVATLEIRPQKIGMHPLGSGMAESVGDQSLSPQFYGTEFEKIKSRNTLEKVVENLDLEKRWNVDKDKAVEILKKDLATSNIRGTDLVQIRVRNADEQDAKDIVREVAFAYKQYRDELVNQESDRALAELRRAVRDQEDKVEERRKVLSTIVRTKGISYTGEDSFYKEGNVDPDAGAKGALAAHKALEQEKMKLESEIESLLKYESDELLTYASGVNLPDNVVKQAYPEYLEEKRNLDALKVRDIGHEHPERIAAERRVVDKRRQLDEGVASLRATLKAQYDLATDRLAKVEVMEDDMREDAIKRGLDAQDYVDAKRDFETEQALLQQMKLKLIGESITDSMPEGSVVIHDLPETDSKSAPRARDALASNSLRRVESQSASAPAKPSSAMAKIIAANESALASIPVPEEESVDVVRYGDDAYFGLGWGDALPANEGREAQSNLTGRADDLRKVGKIAEARALLEGELEKDKENQEVKNALAALDAPIRSNPAMTYEHLRPREKTAPKTSSGKLDTSEYSFKASNLTEDAKPTVRQSVFDFSLETLASEDPYSTFSLHISDASFQLAKAALDKGEQPDPASIKAEQFYNAVDYGDPAPASNEPVAGFIEQAPHPVIPGRQLVRVAVKTAAAGRSAAQPLRLTLLVDASGSMVRDDRRAAMHTAMEKLAGLLGPADRVNVIGFSRTPRLLAQDLPGDQAQNLTKIVNTEASEGGTNLEESIRLAAEIAIRSKTPGAQNRIVLFTDGAANLGNADPARLAEHVRALRQQGVSFDVAGVGTDELNDALLAELARHGDGRYQVIGGKEDGDAFARRLAGAFRPAAENVKVQVRFNPERVASYRLIGFEEHRLKTEDFRNDAVDAAELAAEEAGVAIYQVQTLPEGHGEIGELSVRFRDAAAGGMVERNWTISHDPKSPAFDQTTPSMQLATLSMLAAEKLKGGPLADAIRFEDFAKIRAEVKRFYGDSPRVYDMLGVIDRLR